MNLLGGLEAAEFAWGDEYMPAGKAMANTWQGEFPWQNLVEDGFEWTAPVGSFSPNGYGLHEMTVRRPRRRAAGQRNLAVPERGANHQRGAAAGRIGEDLYRHAHAGANSRAASSAGPYV